MRILITGGSGFIGQYLRPKLHEMGHEVFNIEQYFWKSLGTTSDWERIFLADIRDTFALTDIYRKVKPDVIIHLAAMTAVAYSYDHPHETVGINFGGTMTLAELARRELPNLKQFIYPSSAEVYGVTPIKLKKETDRLIPNSPYAVSKEACERYLQYMFEAYRFPITIFRPFNTYGRIDSHWFVIEKAIWQMVRGQPIVELGDPEPVRDFLYFADHIQAYINALGNPKTIGETFNLCTGYGVTIKRLVDMIAERTEWDGEIHWNKMEPRPLDIMHLVGSNKKLLSTLNVPKPKPLGLGLMLTIRNWREKVEKENDYAHRESS